MLSLSNLYSEYQSLSHLVKWVKQDNLHAVPVFAEKAVQDSVSFTN